jgi:hypothetical protein
MQSILTGGQKQVNAPAVQKVTNDDIGGMIDYRRDCVRRRRWQPMGKLISLSFGITANATLKRLQEGATPRQRMTTFDWMEKDASVIASAGNGVFVFPIGFERPTKFMADAYVNEVLDNKKAAPKFEQDIYDAADMWFASTDGRTKFLCFQPITSIVIRAVSFMKMQCGVDPSTGRHVTLMYDPRTKEAHLVGGVIF